MYQYEVFLVFATDPYKSAEQIKIQLNDYATQGWKFICFLPQNQSYGIFERLMPADDSKVGAFVSQP